MLYTKNIAADVFFYRFGNALVSTFPLVQQILEEESIIGGYVNTFQNQRFAAELYNYKQWDKNYVYKKSL